MKNTSDENLNWKIEPRHLGILRPKTMAVLHVQGKSQIEDTFPLTDLVASPFTSIPAKTLSACLDTLSTQIFFGKASGKGNGIGLINVLATIESLGGTFSVFSRKFIGTEFCIRMPVVESNN